MKRKNQMSKKLIASMLSVLLSVTMLPMNREAYAESEKILTANDIIGNPDLAEKDGMQYRYAYRTFYRNLTVNDDGTLLAMGGPIPEIQSFLVTKNRNHNILKLFKKSKNIEELKKNLEYMNELDKNHGFDTFSLKEGKLYHEKQFIDFPEEFLGEGTEVTFFTPPGVKCHGSNCAEITESGLQKMVAKEGQPDGVWTGESQIGKKKLQSIFDKDNNTLNQSKVSIATESRGAYTTDVYLEDSSSRLLTTPTPPTQAGLHKEWDKKDLPDNLYTVLDFKARNHTLELHGKEKTHLGVPVNPYLTLRADYNITQFCKDPFQKYILETSFKEATGFSMYDLKNYAKSGDKGQTGSKPKKKGRYGKNIDELADIWQKRLGGKSDSDSDLTGIATWIALNTGFGNNSCEDVVRALSINSKETSPILNRLNKTIMDGLYAKLALKYSKITSRDLEQAGVYAQYKDSYEKLARFREAYTLSYDDLKTYMQEAFISEEIRKELYGEKIQQAFTEDNKKRQEDIKEKEGLVDRLVNKATELFDKISSIDNPCEILNDTLIQSGVHNSNICDSSSNNNFHNDSYRKAVEEYNKVRGNLDQDQREYIAVIMEMLRELERTRNLGINSEPRHHELLNGETRQIEQSFRVGPVPGQSGKTQKYYPFIRMKKLNPTTGAPVVPTEWIVVPEEVYKSSQLLPGFKNMSISEGTYLYDKKGGLAYFWHPNPEYNGEENQQHLEVGGKEADSWVKQNLQMQDAYNTAKRTSPLWMAANGDYNPIFFDNDIKENTKKAINTIPLNRLKSWIGTTPNNEFEKAENFGENTRKRSLVDKLLDFSTKQKTYRMYVPIIIRLGYKAPMDIWASKLDPTVELIDDNRAKVKVTACGALLLGEIKNDINTDSRIDFTANIYERKGGLDEKKQLSHISNQSQWVFKDKTETCIKSEMIVPRHPVKEGKVTIEYKINKDEIKPEGELTYKNNIRKVIVPIPPSGEPNLIARKIIPKLTPPPPATSKPNVGMQELNLCIRGIGDSEGLPDQANAVHKLLVDGKVVYERITPIDPAQHYNTPEHCLKHNVPPNQTIIRVCYVVNNEGKPNTLTITGKGLTEESKYTDNKVCENVPIPQPPPKIPNLPPPRGATPHVGCGTYLSKRINPSSNRTYNTISLTGTTPVGSANNIHATAEIVGFTGDIVHTDLESTYEEEKRPRTYAWFDTLQIKENSQDITAHRYKVGSKGPGWYSYDQKPENPMIQMRSQVTAFKGYVNEAPMCGSGNHQNWKPQSTGTITGTEIKAGCPSPLDVVYKKKSICGWVCVDRNEDGGCDKYEWKEVSAEYETATLCPDPEVKTHYPENANLQYNGYVSHDRIPEIKTYQGFTKLDNANQIKAGYGFKAKGSYTFSTDWDKDITTNPFMVRPEKQSRLWENTNNYPQYTDANLNTYNGQIIDAIGIKNGSINNAYLGVGPLKAHGHGNSNYTGKGYNRLVNLGTIARFTGGKSLTWRANAFTDASGNYRPLPSNNYIYVRNFEMKSDLARMISQGIDGVRWSGGGGTGKDDWSVNNVYGGKAYPQHIIYAKYPDGMYQSEMWAGIEFKSGSAMIADIYDCNIAGVQVKGNLWDDTYVTPSDENRGLDRNSNQLGTDDYNNDTRGGKPKKEDSFKE